MRWLTLLVMAFVLVASGCGGSDDDSAASGETTIDETVTQETAAESTTDASAHADTDLSGAFDDLDCPVLAYIGWSLWPALGYGDDSGAASKVPDEIKADVEILAQALVTHSATFEDLFPPEDLGIEPGFAPLDNEVARFGAAINSLDQAGLTPVVPRLEAWTQEKCTG